MNIRIDKSLFNIIICWIKQYTVNFWWLLKKQKLLSFYLSFIYFLLSAWIYNPTNVSYINNYLKISIKKIIESKTDKKYWKFDKRVKAITKLKIIENISFFLNSIVFKNLNIINNVKGNR